MSNSDFMERIWLEYGELMRETAEGVLYSNDDVEDVLHDSVVRLMPVVPKLRTLSNHSLTVYLYRTVKNTALNHNRSRDIEAKYVL